MRQRTGREEFWKFTDEEMETAKNTDLPDLLEHLGYHVKRAGSYYTTREMDSLMIKNRRTCQRQYEIVRKRRRNFVVFRRGCG